ncbi:MAG: hypothetical protein H6661_04565 [Ardenticatenaceae bacterium]|nr:hypothetical protein [Ardenticatenaceae bacterium]
MIPRTPVYPQYQLVGLPAVFLLAGAAAALLTRNSRADGSGRHPDGKSSSPPVQVTAQ